MSDLHLIAQLALTEGNTDLAWVVAFLTGRDDLPTGVRVEDVELGRLPACENIRVGLRELHRLGLLEVRVERDGRPSMEWSVFTPEG